MPLKKSDLYASIWASCDELRGGMDASQYKDYVLFMLFIKYITDKYGNSADFAPPVNIPTGASDDLNDGNASSSSLRLVTNAWIKSSRSAGKSTGSTPSGSGYPSGALTSAIPSTDSRQSCS